MRCPKCHYLSFEPEPRCRNCGFDLSGDPADLSLRIDEPGEPIADLALRPEEPPARAPVAVASEPAAAERPVRDATIREVPARDVSSREGPGRDASAREVPPRGAPGREAPGRDVPVRDMPVAARAPSVAPFRRSGNDMAPASADEARPEPPSIVAPPVRSEPPPRPVAVPAATTELPLFVKSTAATAPPPPAAPVTNEPRPPDDASRSSLAVPRRTQPGAPRPPRPRPETGPRKPGPFDGDLLEDLQRIERIERGLAPQAPARRDSPAALASGSGDAEPWRGLLAAAIDASFVGLLNVAILWITLRWTDLQFVDASLLPALPLGTFFVLVALAYLLMFTAAGGQTVGKMIAGVRVVDADAGDASDQAISVQQAALRSVLAVSSVLMLGLGFLPALLGSGKSLHDRLAHTRIVRA